MRCANDPAKVKAAVISGVLIAGASIGIGISILASEKKNNASAIVQNKNAAAPPAGGEVAYKDSSPTNVKDIVDELKSSARYSNFNVDPLENDKSSEEDIVDKVNEAEWLDDVWSDDGWNNDGYKEFDGYSDYNVNPLENDESNAEDHIEVNDVEWLDDVWSDDGWNNDGYTAAENNVETEIDASVMHFDVSGSMSDEVASVMHVGAPLLTPINESPTDVPSTSPSKSSSPSISVSYMFFMINFGSLECGQPDKI